MMEQEEDLSLFSLLAQGDKLLKTLHKKTILYVGKTKGGKSTSLQWTLSKPLKGQAQSQNGIPYYANMQQQGASIGYQFTSCTIIPNVMEIITKNNLKYSLADMAGFDDSRDYKGIITVAYMLKVVLDSIEQAKFIIVISAQTVQDDNLKNAIDTFVEFVKMFDFSNLSENIQKKIYSSSTLIITKTSKPIQTYLERLKKLLNDYQSTKNKVTKEKKYVIELLAHLIEKTKITLFPAAVRHQGPNPHTCPLANKLEDEEWAYINVKNIKQDYQKKVQKPTSSPFISPLITDSDQQERFLQDIDFKIQMIKKFALLIKEVVQTAVSNQNCYENVDYSLLIQKLTNYLKIYDIYVKNNRAQQERLQVLNQFGFAQTIDPKIPKKESMHGVKMMNLIKQIYQNTIFLEAIGQTQKLKLQALKKAMLKTIKLLKDIICKTEKQQNLMIDLAYIISRTCRQLQILRQIDQTRILDPVNISDIISGMPLQQLHQLQAKFILQMTQKYKQLLKKDDKERQQVVKFIIDFLVYARNKEIDLKQLIKPPMNHYQIQLILIQLMITEADSLIQKNKNIQACQTLVNLLPQIEAFQTKFMGQYQNQNQHYFDNKQNPAQEFYIQVYQNLAQCLKKSKSSTGYQTARAIYQHINYVEPACQCWEKIIEMEKSKQEKYKLMEDYFEYLSKNARLDKMTKCLQDLYRFSYDAQKRNESRKRYNDYLLDYKVMFDPNNGKNWEKFKEVKFNQDVIYDAKQEINRLRQKLNE